MTEAAPSPFALLKPAASGDLEALRAQIDHSLTDLAQQPSPTIALIEGLIFARLAASIGTIRDKGRVLSMLALLGSIADDEDIRASASAEAIATASILADQGGEVGELAAHGVNEVVALSDDPDLLEAAKAIEAELRSAYA